jgi:hypothetical protein
MQPQDSTGGSIAGEGVSSKGLLTKLLQGNWNQICDFGSEQANVFVACGKITCTTVKVHAKTGNMLEWGFSRGLGYQAC